MLGELTVIEHEEAFMASKSHQANILSSNWNATAIGVAVGSDGRPYVTPIFGRMTTV